MPDVTPCPSDVYPALTYDDAAAAPSAPLDAEIAISLPVRCISYHAPVT